MEQSEIGCTPPLLKFQIDLLDLRDNIIPSIQIIRVLKSEYWLEIECTVVAQCLICYP